MPRKDRDLNGYRAKWLESQSSTYFEPLTIKDPFDQDLQIWVCWPQLVSDMKPESIATTLRHISNGLSLALYPDTPEYLFTFSAEYQCVYTWHETAYQKWKDTYAAEVDEDKQAIAKARFNSHSQQPIEFYRLCGHIREVVEESVIALKSWEFKPRVNQYVLTTASEKDLKLAMIKTAQCAPDPVHNIKKAGRKVLAYTPDQFQALQQRWMREALHTQKNYENVILPFFKTSSMQGTSQSICVLNPSSRFHEAEAKNAIQGALDQFIDGISANVTVDLSCRGWIVLTLSDQFFSEYQAAYKVKTGLSLVRGEGEMDPYQLKMQALFFTSFPGYRPPVSTISFDQLTSLLDIVNSLSSHSGIGEKPTIDVDVMVVGTLSIIEELKHGTSDRQVSRKKFGELMFGIGADIDWFYAFVYLLRLTFANFKKYYGDCSLYTFLSAVNSVRRQIFDIDRYANIFSDEGSICFTRKETNLEICDLNAPATLIPSHAEQLYRTSLKTAKQSRSNVSGLVSLLQVQVAALSTVLLQMAPEVLAQQVQTQQNSRLQHYLEFSPQVTERLLVHKPDLFMKLLETQKYLFVAQSQIEGADKGLYLHNLTEERMIFKKGHPLAWYQGDIIDAAAFRSSASFDAQKSFCTALGENSVGHASCLIRHNPENCMGPSAYYANHNMDGVCELRTVYGRGGLEVGKVLKFKKPLTLEPGQVIELSFNYGPHAAMEIHGIPEGSLRYPAKAIYFHLLESLGDIFVLPLGEADKAAWLQSSQEKSEHHAAERQKARQETLERRRVQAAKRRAKANKLPKDAPQAKKAHAMTLFPASASASGRHDQVASSLQQGPR